MNKGIVLLEMNKKEQTTTVSIVKSCWFLLLKRNKLTMELKYFVNCVYNVLSNANADSAMLMLDFLLHILESIPDVMQVLNTKIEKPMNVIQFDPLLNDNENYKQNASHPLDYSLLSNFNFADKDGFQILSLFLDLILENYLNHNNRLLKTSHEIIAFTIVNKIANYDSRYLSTIKEKLNLSKFEKTDDGLNNAILSLKITLNYKEKKLLEDLSLKKELLNMIESQNIAKINAAIAILLPWTRKIVYDEFLVLKVLKTCLTQIDNDFFIFQKSVLKFISNITWNLATSSSYSMECQHITRKIMTKLLCHSDAKVSKEAGYNIAQFLKNGDDSMNGCDFFEMKLPPSLLSPFQSGFPKTINLSKHFAFSNMQNKSTVASSLSLLLEQIFKSNVSLHNQIMALLSIIKIAPIVKYKDVWIPFLLTQKENAVSYFELAYSLIATNECTFHELPDLFEFLSYLLAGISETDLIECFVNDSTFNLHLNSTLSKSKIMKDIFCVSLKVLNLYYTIVFAAATDKNLIKQNVFESSSLSGRNDTFAPNQSKLDSSFQKLCNISKLGNRKTKSSLQSNYFDYNNQTQFLRSAFGAFENFSKCTDQDSRQKFLDPLEGAIQFMNCYLELISLDDLLVIYDELIIYLQITLSVCPNATISLIHQMLKAMFSKNIANMKLVDLKPPVDLLGFNFLDMEGIYLDQAKNNFFVYVKNSNQKVILDWNFINMAGYTSDRLFDRIGTPETVRISNTYLRSFDPILNRILLSYSNNEDPDFRIEVIKLMNQFDNIGLNYMQADKQLSVWKSLSKYYDLQTDWDNNIIQNILVFLSQRTLSAWIKSKIFPKYLNLFISSAETKGSLHILSDYLTLLPTLPFQSGFDILTFYEDNDTFYKWLETDPIGALHLVCKLGYLKNYFQVSTLNTLIEQYVFCLEKYLKTNDVEITKEFAFMCISSLNAYYNDKMHEWSSKMLTDLVDAKKYGTAIPFLYAIIWFREESNSNQSHICSIMDVAALNCTLFSILNKGIKASLLEITNSEIQANSSDNYDFIFCIYLHCLENIFEIESYNQLTGLFKANLYDYEVDEDMAIYLPRTYGTLCLLMCNSNTNSILPITNNERILKKFTSKYACHRIKKLLQLLNPKMVIDNNARIAVATSYLFAESNQMNDFGRLVFKENASHYNQALFYSISYNIEQYKKFLYENLEKVAEQNYCEVLKIGISVLKFKIVTEQREESFDMYCQFIKQMWGMFRKYLFEESRPNLINSLLTFRECSKLLLHADAVMFSLTEIEIYELFKVIFNHTRALTLLDEPTVNIISFLLSLTSVKDLFENDYVSIDICSHLFVFYLKKLSLKPTICQDFDICEFEIEDTSKKIYESKIKNAFKLTQSLFNAIKKVEENVRLKDVFLDGAKKLLRVGIFYDFTLIPEKAKKYGYKPKVFLTTSQIKVQFISIHLLNHHDVVSDFGRRISCLGWKERRQFEDFWMSLFGVLSSTPCAQELEQDDGDEVIEQLLSSAMAVDCLTNNLLQSFLFPIPGDTLDGVYPLKNPHTESFSKLQFNKEQFNVVNSILRNEYRSKNDSTLHFETYDLCQMTLYHIWKVTKTLEQTPNNKSSQIQNSNELPKSVSKFLISMTDDLDTNSSLKALLDNFAHWFSKGISEVPLNLLSSSLRSVILLSDLFDDIYAYKLLFKELAYLFTLDELPKTSLNGLMVYFALKHISVVGLAEFDENSSESENIATITTMIKSSLESDSIFTKYCVFSGTLFLSQSYLTDHCQDLLIIITEAAFQQANADDFNLLPHIYQILLIRNIFSFSTTGVENILIPSSDLVKLIFRLLTNPRTEIKTLNHFLVLTEHIILSSNQNAWQLVEALLDYLQLTKNIRNEELLLIQLTFLAKAFYKYIDGKELESENVIKLLKAFDSVLSFIRNMEYSDHSWLIVHGMLKIGWFIKNKNMLLDLVMDQIVHEKAKNSALKCFLHLLATIFRTIYEETTANDIHDNLLLSISSMLKVKLVQDNSKAQQIMRTILCASSPIEIIRQNVHWVIFNISHIAPNYDNFLFTSLCEQLSNVAIESSILENTMKNVLQANGDEDVDESRCYTFFYSSE
uniref:DUF3730 domain-containing protein n=1 Tax=Rhabditophanes sp. KR3021 TaxID=114890 RepID=A0AC35U6G4_9BILA